MRHLAIALIAATALLTLPSAVAQQSATALTIEADDGDTCIEGQAANCFHVMEGSLDDLETGMLVNITLVNVGDNPHNIYVTEEENADTDTRDTSTDDAIGGSDTIDPGEETQFMFTIPDETESLYLWCDVGPHEVLGMYLTTDVEQVENDGGDQNGEEDTRDPADDGDDEQDPDGDEEQGIPFPGLVPIVGTLALAAATKRR